MTHESPAHTLTCTPREGHREVVGDRVGKGNKQTLKEEAKAERDREENRRQKKKRSASALHYYELQRQEKYRLQDPQKPSQSRFLIPFLLLFFLFLTDKHANVHRQADNQKPQSKENKDEKKNEAETTHTDTHTNSRHTSMYVHTSAGTKTSMYTTTPTLTTRKQSTGKTSTNGKKKGAIRRCRREERIHAHTRARLVDRWAETERAKEEGETRGILFAGLQKKEEEGEAKRGRHGGKKEHLCTLRRPSFFGFGD